MMSAMSHSTTRREFLALTAASLIPAHAAAESHQASGVKVGEITPDSVLIWTRRTKASARKVDRWNKLDRRIVRLATDNKLDRNEWRRADNGRLLKCDALDHHQSHDLIGCQPVEWDIAGAITEFELDENDVAELVCASGCATNDELLDFYCVAYPAFRLGHARLAAQIVSASSQVSDADRYTRRLQLLLHENTRARETAAFLV